MYIFQDVSLKKLIRINHNHILNTNLIVLDPVVFEMYKIKHFKKFISDIQIDSNSDWIPPCLQTTCVTEFQILGWINNETELNTVLEAHKRSSLCSFVTW